MESGVNDLRRSHTGTRISRPGNHLCKGFRLPSTLRRQEKILTTCSPTGSCRQRSGSVSTVRPLALCPQCQVPGTSMGSSLVGTRGSGWCVYRVHSASRGEEPSPLPVTVLLAGLIIKETRDRSARESHLTQHVHVDGDATGGSCRSVWLSPLSLATSFPDLE